MGSPGSTVWQHLAEWSGCGHLAGFVDDEPALVPVDDPGDDLVSAQSDHGFFGGCGLKPCESGDLCVGGAGFIDVLQDHGEGLGTGDGQALFDRWLSVHVRDVAGAVSCRNTFLLDIRGGFG